MCRMGMVFNLHVLEVIHIDLWETWMIKAHWYTFASTESSELRSYLHCEVAVNVWPGSAL